MKSPESKNNIPTQELETRMLFSGLSIIMDEVLSPEQGDSSLRVSNIIDSINGSIYINDNSTISSTKRLEDGSAKISLGAVPFGKESVDSFGWGVDSAKEQLLIKLAHESAHAFQEQFGYEQALVNFLNGSNDIGENFHPYIELYVFLNSKGVCNGLADMDVYHEQSRDTGLLSMNTLEDVTEFIGAYIISDDYFNFRLNASRITLTEEDKEKIATLVIQIVG